MMVIDPLTTGVAIAGAKVLGADKLINSTFGPMLSELGEVLREGFFQKRLLAMEARAEEKLRAAKLKPAPVAPLIMVPIIQRGVLEENEELSDKWTSMLANAANAKRPGLVLPSFPGTLSKLTPQAVYLLDALSRVTERRGGQRVRSPENDARRVVPANIISDDDLDIAVSLLISEDLIEREVRLRPKKGTTAQQSQWMREHFVRITPLGRRFVEACSTPVAPSRKKKPAAKKTSAA